LRREIFADQPLRQRIAVECGREHLCLSMGLRKCQGGGLMSYS
jgi:hypothetical protein